MRVGEETRLRILKEEKYRRLKQQQWRENPMLWLKERFGEEPSGYVWSGIPAYKSHEWDGDVDPLANAWNSLAKNEWVGLQAGTGTGKTHALSRIVFWFLDCWEDSLVVTSAPKQDQLRLHLWAEITKSFRKFRKIRPHSKLTNLRLVVDSRGVNMEDDEDIGASNAWQAVGFVAGTGADEQSATKAQGFHRKDMLIIMEECPGMPEATMTAFQNTSTGGHNLVLAVGNPDSELDPLNVFCELDHVANFRLSSYDYPNVVIGKELMHGAVTRQSIERRKIQYGENSNLYKSRVRGICPSESADSLIKIEWIKQCINTPEEETNPMVYSYYNGAGVDVAASEAGDKGAMASGVRGELTFLRDFRCPNASHLGYNLIYTPMQLEDLGYNVYNLPTLEEMAVIPSLVGIDSVGVGVSTLEALANININCVGLTGGQWLEALPMGDDGKPLYHFSSLRAQMYWEAREDLRRKYVRINTSNIEPEIVRQLIKELSTPKVEHKAGKVSVEPKESIKKRMGGKSPNLADAFVYWNFMRKGYKIDFGVMPISAGK